MAPYNCKYVICAARLSKNNITSIDLYLSQNDIQLCILEMTVLVPHSIFQSKCSLSLFAVQKNQAWHFEYGDFFICNYINNKCKKPVTLLRRFYIFGGTRLKRSNDRATNNIWMIFKKLKIDLWLTYWTGLDGACPNHACSCTWASCGVRWLVLHLQIFLTGHLSLKTDHLEGGLILALTVYKPFMRVI